MAVWPLMKFTLDEEARDMIEIKAFFTGWTAATPEQARRFVLHLLNGSNVSRSAMVRAIEARHLRGVTVAELLEGASA